MPCTVVMSQFGCHPESRVYVGDNPSKDFQAPRTLGWNTVRLRVRGQLHQWAEPLSPDAAAHRDCGAVGELRRVLLGRRKARPVAAYEMGVSDHGH
jgi:hypothetical protein